MTGFRFDLPEGLTLRPEAPADRAFLERLHTLRRADLRLADAEPEYIESVVDMQYRAQTEGYGAQFPNALYFVIEKLGTAVGRLCLDFGPNEVRVVDLAFLPEARGKGYGSAILKAMQRAARQTMTPVTLTVQTTNVVARRTMAALGFQLDRDGPLHQHLIWYPTREG